MTIAPRRAADDPGAAGRTHVPQQKSDRIPRTRSILLRDDNADAGLGLILENRGTKRLAHTPGPRDANSVTVDALASPLRIEQSVR